MTELTELGLSSYEERVYRTLLVSGSTTAAALSDASGVPRGRIYDVLNDLETRQLVHAKSTEPTRYTAVEPDAAVSTLLAERTAELQREWVRYCEVASAVRSNLLPTRPVEGNIWLGSLGSEEMQVALREHMRTATSSVQAVVGPPYEKAPWETLEREVDAFFAGTESDVCVSLLLSEQVLDTIPDSFFERFDVRDGIRIRILSGLELSFDVVDSATATIDIPHPWMDADRLGVVAVQDNTVLDELERHFQTLWGDAVPLPETK